MGQLYIEGKIARVDPRLLDSFRTAVEQYPYDVMITPGGGTRTWKPGGTTNHPGGWAIDYQIRDPVTGTFHKDNYRDPESFRRYEQLAQMTRAVQVERYPELNGTMRYGGYFGGRYAFDQMHIDINPRYHGAMSMGSWEHGLGKDAAGNAIRLPKYMLSAQTAGMGAQPDPLSVDQIKGIQTQLAEQGLYKGEIDGMWGRETDAAMRSAARAGLTQVAGTPTVSEQESKWQEATGGATSDTMGLTEAETKEVQSDLAERGLYKGPIDGKMTPDLQTAISTFASSDEAKQFMADAAAADETASALGGISQVADLNAPVPATSVEDQPAPAQVAFAPPAENAQVIPAVAQREMPAEPYQPALAFARPEPGGPGAMPAAPLSTTVATPPERSIGSFPAQRSYTPFEPINEGYTEEEQIPYTDVPAQPKDDVISRGDVPKDDLLSSIRAYPNSRTKDDAALPFVSPHITAPMPVEETGKVTPASYQPLPDISQVPGVSVAPASLSAEVPEEDDSSTNYDPLIGMPPGTATAFMPPPPPAAQAAPPPTAMSQVPAAEPAAAPAKISNGTGGGGGFFGDLFGDSLFSGKGLFSRLVSSFGKPPAFMATGGSGSMPGGYSYQHGESPLGSATAFTTPSGRQYTYVDQSAWGQPSIGGWS